ncbi:DUF6221 family protein [Nocardia aurantiaca]|uniref:Uncharacterized protein n=1 Tax=Nocardia aurantiaca TaxID=2675850 RepID=A0A6I3KUW3_9NOCA|nr:DUF6221 family protein [Nocardia aurantiaca]MTE11824.1 hypothetical protein [Nocardia aurantiaca]
MTIEEFIEARIDKQQEAAEFALQLEHDFRDTGRVINYEWVRFVRRHGVHTAPSSVFLPGAPTPAQTLRQCAALRHAIGLIRLAHVQSDGYSVDEVSLELDLRPVAAIWSDHPDYCPEWAQA